MNKVIPVILVTIAITLIWGAVTNNKPLDALKMLLQGKSPNKAGDIAHYSDYTKETDPDRIRQKKQSAKLPDDMPKRAGGETVTGTFIPLHKNAHYPVIGHGGNQKAVVDGGKYPITGNNPGVITVHGDTIKGYIYALVK